MNICFVAHNAYGAMLGGTQGHIGGVERQVSMVAKLLVKKGHQVSLITWNESGTAEENIDGVRVIKVCRREDGLPGLRFFMPRWTSLNKALKQADADLYYQNGAEYVTGQVAWWCKRHRKKFVFSSASDMDTDAALPDLTKSRERVLYRFGLRSADGVWSQTERQREALQKNFGIDSTIMAMPCPGPNDQEYLAPVKPDGQLNVLWVGRIHPIKRLEMLLDVADAAQNIRFHVAGGGDADSGYVEPLLERMASMPNVDYHGQLNRSEIQNLYKSCHVLSCTSSLEGFPNTFLESWSYGLPVVTTFDPDSVVVSKTLGLSGSGVGDIVDCLEMLRCEQTAWNDFSINARKYYLENYQEDAVINKYVNYFQGL